MAFNKKDFCIIIRGAKERTEKACVHLAKEQGVPENVVLLNEVPFFAALKKGFEIGMDFNCRWTLCLDADQLLGTNAIGRCLAELDKLPENVFRANPHSIWKFHQVQLSMGMHCYRTKYLPEAYSVIDKEKDNMKPETGVMFSMMNKGYSVCGIDVFCGLTDYELYYSDIYRRIRYRSSKSSIREYRVLMKVAKAFMNSDDDFKIVYKALKDGRINPIHHHGTDTLSDCEISKAVESCGLEEKDELSENYPSSEVDKVLEGFTTFPSSVTFEQAYWNMFGKIERPVYPKIYYAHRWGKFFRYLLWLFDS
jgi:hypothetical protein